VNNRWFNAHLPQTLQIAVLLLYIDAVFLVIYGAVYGIYLLIVVGFVAGGYGIANEKKWGYIVGLVSAIIQVLILLSFGLNAIVNNGLILNLMFDAALVALLAHPQSREYQRIWFK
jgi:hypothetical protein